MQTLPPEEEFKNYTIFDIDVTSALYPELMFLCKGILSGVNIPYSTTETTPWDDIVTLSLTIWKYQPHAGYAPTSLTLQIQPQGIRQNRGTGTIIRGIAQFISLVQMEKYDILQFNVPARTGEVREHIPFLLRDYTEGCTTPGCLIPVIQVDFTSSEVVIGKDLIWSAYQVNCMTV